MLFPLAALWLRDFDPFVACFYALWVERRMRSFPAGTGHSDTSQLLLWRSSAELSAEIRRASARWHRESLNSSSTPGGQMERWGIHPSFLSGVKSKVFRLCTFLPTEVACWALSYHKISSRYCLCIWNSPQLKARHQQIQHLVPLEYEVLWWECKHPHNNRWRGKCWTLLSVLNCGWVDLELSIRDKNIRHFIIGN